jgi:hypothetical protein
LSREGGILLVGRGPNRIETTTVKSVFVRVLCISALSMLALFPARAEKQGNISREQAEALVSGLKYQQGEITLQNGLATLRVPDGLRFLNGPDAQTVLVKLWGNPPRSSDPLASGWRLGWLSAVDSEGRTLWIVDAHRDNGKRFVVRSDEKLTAFLELERITHELALSALLGDDSH